LPAVAVSVTERKGNFAAAAEFAVDFGRRWQQNNFEPRALFNINVPGLPEDEIKGWRYTSMGWRFYNNEFSTIEEKGQNYYWLGGDRVDGQSTHGQTDVEVAGQGYISVTPLQYNLTNYQLLDDLLAKS
jgi:5'-nucleotidase